MTGSPLVTVALPYATASPELVSAALDSLTAQEFQAWSGFVLDDSPNGNATVERLVSEYDDPRLHYVRNEGPHGIGNAWNACIERVNTDLFCLLHTDDELERTYLKTMLRLAETYPTASIYFCDANIIDEKGDPCFSLPDAVKRFIAPKSEPMVLEGHDAVRQLAIGDFIMCPTMMYRTTKVGRRRFSTNHSFVLDYRFILDVILSGETIVGTHKRAYRYRRHSDQWTRSVSISGHRFQEELEVLRELEAVSAQRNWPSVRRVARMRPILRLNVAYEVLCDVIGRRPVGKEKLRYLIS